MQKKKNNDKAKTEIIILLQISVARCLSVHTRFIRGNLDKSDR